MSAKRRRLKPKRATAPAHKGKASRRGVSRRLLVGLGIALLAGLAAGLYWGLPRSGAELPAVDLAGLDTNATALIEEQLAAVRAQPRSGEAWGRLGMILQSYRFDGAARRCLEEAERLDPEEPRWPYWQGRLDLSSSRTGAIVHFRRTVALCGNEPAAPRVWLARLLAETGDRAGARHEWEALLAAKPGFAPAQLALAQLDQAEGNWDDAWHGASLCTTNPYTAKAALSMLSALHQRRGATNAARRARLRAEALQPDASLPDPYDDEIIELRGDPRSLSDRAQSFLVSGRVDQAYPLAQRLVKEHPGFSESWLVLGRAQIMRREPAPAERSLRHFLEMDPTSVTGLFQLGLSLLAQQRFAEAADVFARATELKPDFGPAYFNLGMALARAGKKREAIAPFQQAIRHNPERIDSYILLADLHLQLGEKEDAMRLAALAAELDPRDRRLPVLEEKIRSRE